MGAPRPDIDLVGLACQLSQLADNVRQKCGVGSQERTAASPEGIHQGVSNPDLLTIAQAWGRASSAREAVFGAGLFSDPAWNMLLDLYIQRAKSSPVSVSSLSIAARTPATTALRWIALLESRTLVTRHPDPFDRRRCLIQLTDLAVERIEAALQQASDSDRRLGLGRLQRLN